MPLGSFRFFSKIRGNNRERMLFSGVNDTGDKREKCSGIICFHFLWRAYLSVHYTYRWNFCVFFIIRCRQANIGMTVYSPVSLTTLKNLSAVSLTPVNSFLAVSLTPAINFRLFSCCHQRSFSGGVNNTGDKFIAGINDTFDQRKSVTKINRRCQRHRW